MNISPHFEDTEFEIDGPFPSDCLPIVTEMCEKVLEPIRQKFGAIRITSGYRGPGVNALVHGVTQSQHEYTPTQCAVDWWISDMTMRDVFDWIRLESGLPVDQIILEHGHTDIIHTSYTPNPRQEALEGLTGNRSGYVQWKFNKVVPPEQS